MVPKLQAIATACQVLTAGNIVVRSMLATSGAYVVAENLCAPPSGRIPVAGLLIGWKTLEESSPTDIRTLIADLHDAVA